MKMQSSFRWALAVTLVASAALAQSADRPSPASGNAPAGLISVRLVKYDALKQAVKDLRGKVVVVDFWSTT